MMSDYRIRLYKDSDFEVVRDIFARGMLQHTHKAFRQGLSVPRNLLSILLIFLVSLWISGSAIVPVLVVVAAVFTLWFFARHVYSSFVKRCLSDDMLNIDNYYLQRDGYCFWVAEFGREVVGAVAAAPSPHSGGEKHTELRRMTIAKKYRGRGIAKALCRVVINFAQQTGCAAVVLETSFLLTDARRLYERVGFRVTHTIRRPHFRYRLFDFIHFHYQYDIPTCK